jgi:hypothetical protein
MAVPVPPTSHRLRLAVLSIYCLATAFDYDKLVMNTSLIRRAFPLLALTFGLACASQASQIATVTFVGTPTGVNDGVFAVLPYEVTIDTGSGPVSQFVTCYDTLDEVGYGDVWSTDLLSLNEASTSGFFSTLTIAQAQLGYQEVAWLNSQTYANADQQIALQHAIWNVFGTAPANQNSNQDSYYADYESALAIQVGAGFDGFDFGNFVFIQKLGDTAGGGTKQAFVYEAIPGTPNSITPEPGTWAMIVGGLSLVVLSRRRFSRN